MYHEEITATSHWSFQIVYDNSHPVDIKHQVHRSNTFSNPINRLMLAKATNSSLATTITTNKHLDRCNESTAAIHRMTDSVNIWNKNVHCCNQWVNSLKINKCHSQLWNALFYPQISNKMVWFTYKLQISVQRDNIAKQHVLCRPENFASWVGVAHVS